MCGERSLGRCTYGVVQPYARWTRKHRFYVTRVPGPCMRHYNVLNDCTLGPNAEGVLNKQQVGGAGRSWPLASLQSAQTRVLVRAPWPSAVVSSLGLLRHHCAALAASRGCRTSSSSYCISPTSSFAVPRTSPSPSPHCRPQNASPRIFSSSASSSLSPYSS